MTEPMNDPMNCPMTLSTNDTTTPLSHSRGVTTPPLQDLTIGAALAATAGRTPTAKRWWCRTRR